MSEETKACPKCGATVDDTFDGIVTFECGAAIGESGYLPPEFPEVCLEGQLSRLRALADKLAEAADLMRRTFEIHMTSYEPCDGDSCDCITRNCGLFLAKLSAYRQGSQP